MPFGLKNAPSVFQRLMQLVLADLNPRDGKSFVSAYIDDMRIFSSTLEEHLEHLRKVIARCQEVNLKLNLVKCRFVLRDLGVPVKAGMQEPGMEPGTVWKGSSQ